ncbi:MAG TPA: hypothetical protein VFT66_07265 [Roseiflexaceae bacterium]|jgi:hypothetical protein|nr:hypothetical protein [Roseiflexaceae bacterium]
MIAEHVHQYPRRIRWSVELFCAVVVTLATMRFGRDLLLWMWSLPSVAAVPFPRMGFMLSILRVLRASVADPAAYNRETSLLPALGLLALALLLTLLLRNSLPTVRTSARGVLVEFSGSWLPIPWENIRTIKVTEDASAERFVLLAETDRKQLTGWHRFYSFIYGLRFRRGFLITSWINDFDRLIKTLLNETDRIARVLDVAKPTQLQEEASSAFFRFVLGPTSFFSQRTKEEAAAVAVPAPAPSRGDVLLGTYPRRISSLILWGTRVLLLFAFLRYIIGWMMFLALMFPALRALPVFNRLSLFQGQLAAPWWVLVSTHLMVLAVFGVVVMLRQVLPDLEARTEGLAVRRAGRWHIVPWARIQAMKVTELSEDNQIVLIQARGGLPWMARFNSLFYDGSFAPGILVTSALSTFEEFMKRVVLEVTRHQEASTAADSPILQDEARSPLLMLSFSAGPAIDTLVEESREDARTKLFDTQMLFHVAKPMIALALVPALIVFAGRAIQQSILPDARLIIGMLFLFVLSMLEWPVICLAAQLLDDATGGGEEGARPFYLYPTVQLPRVLPLLGALLVTLLGIPYLPVLLWLGAIVWAFLLAAGLWEALYQWRGGQLLAGGLLPAVFQLLILLSYLIAL